MEYPIVASILAWVFIQTCWTSTSFGCALFNQLIFCLSGSYSQPLVYYSTGAVRSNVSPSIRSLSLPPIATAKIEFLSNERAPFLKALLAPRLVLMSHNKWYKRTIPFLTKHTSRPAQSPDLPKIYFFSSWFFFEAGWILIWKKRLSRIEKRKKKESDFDDPKRWGKVQLRQIIWINSFVVILYIN